MLRSCWVVERETHITWGMGEHIEEAGEMSVWCTGNTCVGVVQNWAELLNCVLCPSLVTMKAEIYHTHILKCRFQ